VVLPSNIDEVDPLPQGVIFEHGVGGLGLAIRFKNYPRGAGDFRPQMRWPQQMPSRHANIPLVIAAVVRLAVREGTNCLATLSTQLTWEIAWRTATLTPPYAVGQGTRADIEVPNRARRCVLRGPTSLLSLE
jgi:hypothetical protein